MLDRLGELHTAFRWTSAYLGSRATMCVPQCLVEKLENAGRPYRIAATSPSLNGLWAAVLGGLGVTARTKLVLPGGVVYGDSLFGLPALGSFPVTLHRHSPTNALFDRMIELLVHELTLKLQGTDKAPRLPIGRKA